MTKLYYKLIHFGGGTDDIVKSDTFNTLYAMSNTTQKEFKKDSYKSRKNSINLCITLYVPKYNII